MATYHRRHHQRRLHHQRLGAIIRRAKRYGAAETNGEGNAEEGEAEEGEDGGPAPPAWSKEVNDSNVVSIHVDAPMTDEPAAVWFVPNFLSDDDAIAVLEGCAKLRKKFKRDHSFAVGRLSALARKRLHNRGRGEGEGGTRVRFPESTCARPSDSWVLRCIPPPAAPPLEHDHPHPGHQRRKKIIFVPANLHERRREVVWSRRAHRAAPCAEVPMASRTYRTFAGDAVVGGRVGGVGGRGKIIATARRRDDLNNLEPPGINRTIESVPSRRFNVKYFCNFSAP